MIERILVSCNNQQDLHEWVDHLQKQTKVTSVGNPTIKPHSVPSHTDLSKSPKTMKKLLPKRKPERKPSDEEFALRKSTAALEEDAQILKVIEAYCTSAKTRQTLNSKTTLVRSALVSWELAPLLTAPRLLVCASAVWPTAAQHLPPWVPLDAGCHLGCPDETFSLVFFTPKRFALCNVDSYLLPGAQSSDGAWMTGGGQHPPCWAPQSGPGRSLVDTVYALKDEVQELRQDNKKMKKSLEEEQRARKDLEKLVRKVLKNMNDPAWDETNL
ncbi:hypothetical protein CB1_000287006 [Camelus ferus]|nr:hypothetical protein CB1_000287006 [Camelus ferus]